VVDSRGGARENAGAVRRFLCSLMAASLLGSTAATGASAAGPELRAAEVPLAVVGPEDTADEDTDVPEDRLHGPGLEDRSEAVPRSPGEGMPMMSRAPRVPAPTAAITDRDMGAEQVTVAVGLGTSAPGSKPETAIVDALERAARASQSPPTVVRRLRAGAGEGRSICRERRDDLVILLEYMPDRPDPVLVPRDCRLDRELALRGSEAAKEPGLVGVLWDEHRALVRGGAKERKVRIGRKARTGLIAGGAIVVVGLAVALVLVNSLRRETVVLTVGP
jgi:hypothetical protein